jgi:hypothetical protein
MTTYYDQEEINMINKGNDDLSVADSTPSNLLKNKQPRTSRVKQYTIQRQINEMINGKGYKKTITIRMFGSGDTGTFIRNAVTGEYTNHRVGSKESNLYYSVANCTGLDKMNGPVHLYYNSPSEYEKHQFTTVDEESKYAWLNRVTHLRGKYV